MPFSPIRNGYSSIPWRLPRYCTMRTRLVEICSVTRSSSSRTQSATYSSNPYRVSIPSPRSPRDIGGEAAILEPAEKTPQLDAGNRLVLEDGKQDFDGVEHHALALTVYTALDSRTKRPCRSYSPDSSISLRSMKT
jgi:hypothetical protein